MRTSQNYLLQLGEINSLPSATVPDQSLTLRELLTNYTRGNDLPFGKSEPQFFDEDTFVPDIKKMDLVDIQELMETNAHKAGKLKTELDALSAKKEEEILNLKIDKEIKNRGLVIPPLKNSPDVL